MFGWFGKKSSTDMRKSVDNRHGEKARKSISDSKPADTVSPHPQHDADDANQKFSPFPRPEVVINIVSPDVSAAPVDDDDLAHKSEGSEVIQRDYFKDLGPGSHISLEEIVPDDDAISHTTWEDGMNGLISMIGFTVGISNVWKFPYLCWRYGGIAFLVPYFFFLATCAFPLMYLEVIMGQLLHKGMLRVWKVAPMFQGVGYCLCLFPLLIAFHYNAVYSWCLFYIYIMIFEGSNNAPWAFCTNTWNTRGCKDITPDFEEIDLKPDERRAGEEFFKGRVQRVWYSVFAEDLKANSPMQADPDMTFGLSGKDQGLGWPDWDMCIALLVVYLMTYVFTQKGFETRGKLLWFANFFPYLVMSILIYRAIGMPGTWRFGVKNFILNEDGWKKLRNYETWTAAAQQVLFSTGVGKGIHLTLASFNAFNRNCFRDVVITLAVDTITSIMFTILVFMYVGTVVYSDGGDNIIDVLREGPDLVFSVLADALGRLPGSYFFCTIFFSMVFLVGYTCTLSQVVCAKVSLFDGYNRWFGQHGKLRAILIFLCLALAYLGGLLVIARGGIDVFQWLDHYTTRVPFFTTSLLMVIVFVWIYGIDLIVEGCEKMTGRRPSRYTQFCWTYFCPVCLLVILISLSVTSKKYKVVNPSDVQILQRTFKREWRIGGIVYENIPLILVIVGFFSHLFGTKGKTWKQTFLMGISPVEDYQEIMNTNTSRRMSCSHLWKVMTYCFKGKVKVHPITTPTPAPMPTDPVPAPKAEPKVNSEQPESEEVL